MLNTKHSVIGKYERDEVMPAIEVVKNLAVMLETTVAYLLGEAGSDLLKTAEMLRRLKNINDLPTQDRECILYNLDAVLRDANKACFC